MISRYTGSSPESAPLHRLGSGQWEKAKRKAARQVRDTAAVLLELFAETLNRAHSTSGTKAGDSEVSLHRQLCGRQTPSTDHAILNPC